VTITDCAARLLLVLPALLIGARPVDRHEGRIPAIGVADGSVSGCEGDFRDQRARGALPYWPNFPGSAGLARGLALRD
jgi:hypothetical protein